MSQAQAATGADRLPWLEDEPTPPRKRGSKREVAAWAIGATLIVAAASYWYGTQSWNQSAAPIEATPPSTTVPLPQPRAAEPPQPQVMLERAPEVQPTPLRDVPISHPAIEKRAVKQRSTSAPAAAKEAATPEQADTAAAKAAPSAKPLTAWPASQSEGAEGRIVRVGAFGSIQQAKLGWRSMVQTYPAVAHLKATVVGDRNSRGRHFFRFQIGTTSQAHSEVLCQRMEKIHFSCAVVGLPWKPKGVER
jgi:outer membrane biosynthesis protein TonB